jgi:CRISPR-associated protein Csx14
MKQASIPVDLFNPGQVFACMGFLEAADVLLGHPEGGFDWNQQGAARFELRADGVEGNPFETILEYLAHADVRPSAHRGYEPSPDNKKTKGRAAHTDEKDDEDDDGLSATLGPEALVETFPAPSGDPMALPVRLVDLAGDRRRCLLVTHWADGSRRNKFKLYSGNRSAASIARAMLHGTRKKTTKQPVDAGAVKTRGLAHLWEERRAEMIESPFDVLTSMGGSFNFDPRGAWTAIDAGYSPNDQKHGVEASPVVEMLAAIGLEHARPDEFETREVRYGAWKGFLPPALARPALGGARVGVPIRIFRFTLGLSGKNKIVTFAREETHP